MVKSKGKPKLGNVKVYKKPSDKQFLVVTNPWRENQLDKLKYKDVIGWFEVMLRDKYPAKGFRPHAVYFMRTRSDIIVELPGDVEINEYLGAHAYERFLPPPHISPRDKEIHAEARVYEYNYAKYNDPNKTGWTEYIDYAAIHPNFPVRSPYPVSLPAPQLPPMEVGHALPIPEAVMVVLREREAKIKEGNLLAESLIAETFAAMERSSVKPFVPPSPAPVPVATSAQGPVPMPTRTPAPTRAPSTLSPALAPPPAQDSLFTPYTPPSHHPAHTRYPSVNAGRASTGEATEPCASSSKVEIRKEEKVQDPRKTLDPRRRAAAINLVQEDSRCLEDSGRSDLRPSESNNMKVRSEPWGSPGKKKMEKLDPYEEDEVAVSLLRSPTSDTIRELSVAGSDMYVDVGVKPEEDASKRESARLLSSMPSAGPSLSPSSASRPPSIPRRRCTKPRPMSTSSTPQRQPSPSRLGQSEPATEIGKVKPEPMDIDLPLPLPRPPPLPKRSAFRAALMDGGAGGDGKGGRVKAEPVDQTVPQAQPTKQDEDVEAELIAAMAELPPEYQVSGNPPAASGTPMPTTSSAFSTPVVPPHSISGTPTSTAANDMRMSVKPVPMGVDLPLVPVRPPPLPKRSKFLASRGITSVDGSASRSVSETPAPGMQVKQEPREAVKTEPVNDSIFSESLQDDEDKEDGEDDQAALLAAMADLPPEFHVSLPAVESGAPVHTPSAGNEQELEEEVDEEELLAAMAELPPELRPGLARASIPNGDSQQVEGVVVKPKSEAVSMPGMRTLTKAVIPETTTPSAVSIKLELSDHNLESSPLRSGSSGVGKHPRGETEQEQVGRRKRIKMESV